MSAAGRRSGAGFSLSTTAAVVNHVNARARSLFDFSRRCRFFHPDISHRWIIPDAVRQIIARSLFPGRVVGGNSNPLKNDLLSAARIYACLAYYHSSSHSTTSSPNALPGLNRGPTQRYRSVHAFLLKNNIFLFVSSPCVPQRIIYTRPETRPLPQPFVCTTCVLRNRTVLVE